MMVWLIQHNVRSATVRPFKRNIAPPSIGGRVSGRTNKRTRVLHDGL